MSRFACLLLSLFAASHVDAATLVVLNKAEANASLIDPATGVVRATVPTGQGPHEVAVSPDGRYAIVADYGRREPGNSLTVIDIARARVLRTLDLGEHRRPHGILWPNEGSVLVTAEASQALLRLHPESGAIEAFATGQQVSHMLALDASTQRAFVANIGSGSVSVIDLASGTKLRDIMTGVGAEGIAVRPGSREVWVSNRGEDSLTVIDADSLEIIATLRSASFPIRVAFTPDGRRALVSNAKSSELAIFDAATRQELHRVHFPLAASGDGEGRLFGPDFAPGSVPIGILVEPEGRRAFVAHANADAISVVDIAEGEVVGRLQAGKEPDGLAWSPVDVGSD